MYTVYCYGMVCCIVCWSADKTYWCDILIYWYDLIYWYTDMIWYNELYCTTGVYCILYCYLLVWYDIYWYNSWYNEWYTDILYCYIKHVITWCTDVLIWCTDMLRRYAVLIQWFTDIYLPYTDVLHTGVWYMIIWYTNYVYILIWTWYIVYTDVLYMFFAVEPLGTHFLIYVVPSDVQTLTRILDTSNMCLIISAYVSISES